MQHNKQIQELAKWTYMNYQNWTIDKADFVYILQPS